MTTDYHSYQGHSRNKTKSKSKLKWFFILLLLAGGASGYFYYEELQVGNKEQSPNSDSQKKRVPLEIPPKTSLNGEAPQTKPLANLSKATTAESQVTQAAVASIPTDETNDYLQKTHTVKSGESLSKIFKTLGLPQNELNKITRLKEINRELRSLRPGTSLEFFFDNSAQLHQFNYPLNDTDTLLIKRQGDRYKADREHIPLERQVVYRNGYIADSLFLAGKKANLPDNIIMEMSNIFAWDIDFIYDIRPGDTFQVIYEELYKDGQKLKNGDILVAEFVNRGKTFRAVKYTDDNGHSDYYTPDGLSLRKAFIRAPVNYTRISSHFQKARKHPILHKIRAHNGVDYAAPRGTPIKAAGNGKVIHRGRKGGYGNAVILQHGNKYSTLYAHMSKFAKGLRIGSKVKQGQVIGYVGSTGLASGPHLHYEFRVNGVHKNPLTVKLPKAAPIQVAHKVKFSKFADQQLAFLKKKQQAYASLQ